MIKKAEDAEMNEGLHTRVARQYLGFDGVSFKQSEVPGDGETNHRFHKNILRHNWMTQYNAAIKRIVGTALEGAKTVVPPDTIRSHDRFVFGDVHGQTDLFVQNLYIAGIIDATGHLIGDKPKIVIQMGDMIDKGHQEIEGILFLRWLKEAGKEHGTQFVLLAGNHEVSLMASHDLTASREKLRKILLQDVYQERLVACYADDQAKVLFVHGGLQKEVLLKTLSMMARDAIFEERLAPVKDEIQRAWLRLQEKRKEQERQQKDKVFGFQDISGQRIYEDFVYGCNLALSDLANFLNRQFKAFVLGLVGQDKTKGAAEDLAVLFGAKNSIFNSRKKAYNLAKPNRGSRDPKDFVADRTRAKYVTKPITVVGHCVTAKKVQGFGTQGGIMQNANTIFVDAGLNRKYGGNQAFLSYASTTGCFFGVEITDKKGQSAFNGLDARGHPIPLYKKKEAIQVRML